MRATGNHGCADQLGVIRTSVACWSLAFFRHLEINHQGGCAYPVDFVESRVQSKSVICSSVQGRSEGQFSGFRGC